MLCGVVLKPKSHFRKCIQNQRGSMQITGCIFFSIVGEIDSLHGMKVGCTNVFRSIFLSLQLYPSNIFVEWWLGRDGVFFVLLGHLLNHTYYPCDILYPFVSLLCLVTGDNIHSEFTMFLIIFKRPKPIPHFSLQHYHPNFICVTTKVLEKN